MRAVGLLLVIAMSAASAWAQDASDPLARCRAAFDAAERAFEAELFTDAEDGYREALDCMPPTAERRVLLVMNIALSVMRQGGRDAEALELFRRFRREAEGIAEAEVLVRADGHIRDLEARIERRGGSTEESGGVSPVGPVLIAVGGAAVVAAIAVGAFGLSERSSVLSMCTGTACPAEVEARASNLETYGIVTDALLWPGLAIAAAGGVLTIVLREGGGDSPVACGPGGCAARWSW